MPESTVCPREIEICKIKNGAARLICRWDITEEMREQESESYKMYVYGEAWIWWALPACFEESGKYVYMPDSADPEPVKAYAEEYINHSREKIMNYAKATSMHT